MDPRILSFLSRHRISVFTTQLPDGSLHSAACHYAHIDQQFQLIIFTEDSTRKCLNLLNGQAKNASITIGFSEEEWIELQLSGNVKLIREGAEFDSAKKIFAQKFNPDLSPDPGDVFLIFTPTWYRYTEFKRDPMVKIEENI